MIDYEYMRYDMQSKRHTLRAATSRWRTFFCMRYSRPSAMPRAHASIQRNESARGLASFFCSLLLLLLLLVLTFELASRRSSEPYAQYGKINVIVFSYAKNLPVGCNRIIPRIMNT